VLQGIVQLKEDEFRELTQGGRSVSEYVHKFTEFASQDFLSFSHLSNKAIQVERAREEEKGHFKRKFQVL
jgi:hypothetical protein